MCHVWPNGNALDDGRARVSVSAKNATGIGSIWLKESKQRNQGKKTRRNEEEKYEKTIMLVQWRNNVRGKVLSSVTGCACDVSMMSHIMKIRSFG